MVPTDLRNNRGNKRSVEDSLYLDSLRLISKAKSGDCQAFTALIELHLRRIYAAAVKITRNHEDAEDACQENVLKADLEDRIMLSSKLGGSLPLTLTEWGTRD
jgi:hypothetical protein